MTGCYLQWWFWVDGVISTASVYKKMPDRIDQVYRLGSPGTKKEQIKFDFGWRTRPRLWIARGMSFLCSVAKMRLSCVLMVCFHCLILIGKFIT